MLHPHPRRPPSASVARPARIRTTFPEHWKKALSHIRACSPADVRLEIPSTAILAPHRCPAHDQFAPLLLSQRPRIRMSSPRALIVPDVMPRSMRTFQNPYETVQGSLLSPPAARRRSVVLSLMSSRAMGPHAARSHPPQFGTTSLHSPAMPYVAPKLPPLRAPRPRGTATINTATSHPYLARLSIPRAIRRAAQQCTPTHRGAKRHLRSTPAHREPSPPVDCPRCPAEDIPYTPSFAHTPRYLMAKCLRPTLIQRHLPIPRHTPSFDPVSFNTALVDPQDPLALTHDSIRSLIARHRKGTWRWAADGLQRRPAYRLCRRLGAVPRTAAPARLLTRRVLGCLLWQVQPRLEARPSTTRPILNVSLAFLSISITPAAICAHRLSPLLLGALRSRHYIWRCYIVKRALSAQSTRTYLLRLHTLQYVFTPHPTPLAFCTLFKLAILALTCSYRRPRHTDITNPPPDGAMSI
ncbi:hypothetical protein K438DRAFT_1962198 [Mycena galopus ATCC 62051]|nr:hypothetical protein K438DRAFT_1962198 [Mycena galopus ATCC 62051]